jgi:hypothetical protein
MMMIKCPQQALHHARTTSTTSFLLRRAVPIQRLREVTKEAMTKTQDSDSLAALAAEDLELLGEQRKILKRMLSMTTADVV